MFLMAESLLHVVLFFSSGGDCVSCLQLKVHVLYVRRVHACLNAGEGIHCFVTTLALANGGTDPEIEC